MVGTSIQTGVDRLVSLVSEKKKISVDDAAKKLGVGKDVVQEWAEFLEEEGLVTLDYSFSKMFIIEKKIGRDDVLGSAKEVSSEKEALARKIDVAIRSLQDETAGFEDIRKQFTNIQSHIKEEINVVKSQLTELERYDSLRKNLDKDVEKQRETYSAFVKEAQDKLKLEAQKYDELKDLIEKERKTLEQYSQKLEDLKRLRSDYERTVSSLKESLKNIDSVMSDYKDRFDDSNKIINNYKKELNDLSEELSDKKNGLLNKKLTELKSNEDKLFKKQLEIEEEIKSKVGTIKSYTGLNDKVHKGFGGFFSKNIETEKLILEIEKDKTDLSKDLEALKKKVLAFTLIAGNASIKSELKDLEQSLASYEHKKLSIKYKIEKLLGIIKGN
jgi:DNA repair exonuclease SbcCD ATPase subunit